MGKRDVRDWVPLWMVHWMSSLNLKTVARKGTEDEIYEQVLQSNDPKILVYVAEPGNDTANFPVGKSNTSSLHAQIQLVGLLPGNDLILHKPGECMIRFPIPNLKAFQ